MKRKVVFTLFLQLWVTIATFAHPGTGIVVDNNGQVYFTDTGKGAWKIDANGKLTYLPASRFHWMTLDVNGAFSRSPKNFGDYFESVATKNNNAGLIMCSDFPLVMGREGNIYYANTRPGISKIIRRTPGGKESVVASNRIVSYVSDIAVGSDGSLYITEASDANANTIRKVSMNGAISVIATFRAKSSKGLPLETTPSYCRGLAVDAQGNVYVAATGSRQVLKISPKGSITTILHEQDPWTPTGIGLFHGEVYILEWHDVSRENLEVRTAYIPRVRKISTNGKVSTIAIVSRK